MTDKEIKDLASAYAECATIGLEPHDIEEQRIIEYDFALPVLEWLSERFCLVEKSKLEALQEEIHGEIMCAHDDDDWQSAAHYILDVMPRSFKELFPDTEQ